MFEYELLIVDYVMRYRPEVVALCLFANDLTAVPVSMRLPENEDRSLYYFGPQGVWTRYLKSRPWQEKSFALNLYKQAKLLTEGLADPVDVGRVDTVGRERARDGSWMYRHRGADKHYFEKDRHLIMEQKLADILTTLGDQQIATVICLFPSKASVYNREYGDFFPDTTAYLDIEKEGYRRMCEVAARYEVPCVDLTMGFRAQAAKRRLYFDIDPHWNEAGHSLAAHLVLPHLQ